MKQVDDCSSFVYIRVVLALFCVSCTEVDMLVYVVLGKCLLQVISTQFPCQKKKQISSTSVLTCSFLFSTLTEDHN